MLGHLLVADWVVNSVAWKVGMKAENSAVDLVVLKAAWTASKWVAQMV